MGTQALEYTVVLHWDEEYGGYWVEVPALPGCVSQGKSREEALASIREAIELHLVARSPHGTNYQLISLHLNLHIVAERSLVKKYPGNPNAP